MLFFFYRILFFNIKRENAMNDIIFLKNFRFNEYCFFKTQHRDNSCGVDFHFVGLMKHGKGRIVSQKTVLEIEENEMFYIPKGCPYHSYWIAEDYVKFDSIGFLYFPNTTPCGYKLQKINFDAEISRAFLPLSEEKTVNATSIGALYNLLGLLETKLEQAPYGKDVAVCEKLILLIKDNPQLTVPEYATLCGVSETLLYNYVKKVLKKSPNHLRQEELCAKAKELLYTTTYSIEEISDKLGFGSSTYFRKVFKMICKKPPTYFRKEESAL